MAGYGAGTYGAGIYGGGTVGAPLLPAVLAGATLLVEVAWGADLTADPAGWVWTDITRDVRQDPGITTTMGRGDEASVSQPATTTMLLDNTAARYSLGPQSPNYPNVRRNTPVRVQVDPGDGSFRTVFFGFADGFTPAWNLAATVPDVHLSASGTLRRLLQGASPVASTLRRVLPGNPAVIAYWPCEEGRSAQQINAEIGSPLVITGSPGFGKSDVFDCSGQLPTLDGSSWLGPVGQLTSTGQLQIRWLMDIPVDGTDDNTQLIGLGCSGSISRWDMRYETGITGNLRIRAYDGFGTILLDSAISVGLNGFRGQVGLQLRQVGADVEWDLDFLRVGAAGSSGIGATIAGRTVGGATNVSVNGDGGNADVTIGHIAVYNANTPESENIAQLNAYAGEVTFVRYYRVCDENNIVREAFGDGTGFNAPSDKMGPQLATTVVDLLRQVETADQGVLFDGTNAGLLFTTRRYAENRSPSLTISAAAAKLASPFGPVDDDQRTRNRVQAKRSNGASVTVEDTDGPLGVQTVGLYDTTIEVNAQLDSTVELHAGWLLAKGTVTGYRYPTLSVDLGAAPDLAAAWASLRPGQRIDVTGLDDVLPGHPAGTLSLLVEGLSNDITGTAWTGTARCSPYSPWRVAVTAATTGDTGEYLGRLDTDSSELTTAAAAGATSLAVSVLAGPTWTLTADDYPLVLDVGGVAVRATACTGVLPGARTFTIDPLPLARPAGSPVSVWQPPALGL